MIRADIIATVGRDYLTSNIENDEFSYPKAYTSAALPFTPIRNRAGRAFEKLDIRFVKDNVSVLVETKQNFHTGLEDAKEQLSAYVEYEKALTGNKIVAILANTTNNDVMVWRGVVSEGDFMPQETALRTMDEYVDFYTSKINDKEKVMQNTYKLNEMLHRHSIPEKLRSQFVGTCLLALKNGLDYSTPSLTGAAYATVSTQKPWKNLSFSAFKSQYLLQKRYPRMAFLCYSGRIEGRTANGKHTSLRQRL